ncbi:hypothetical protein AT302_13030 [Pandoraea norimbergensis]|uniref:Uncharacterized protein n=2 Tax=Pandoraea norimbergensis TaxID=93219 RepID=A0ABN4JHY4_9BURK|nr:hypothetical protein AT302_13030 [Pandoraea norimbergensis]
MGAEIADEIFGDMLGGGGCVQFEQGDLQVRVGWLRVGGEGLIVTARVDEGTVGEVRFWCDAQQWSEWLGPWLPVPSFEALPQAWHDIAASLTLAANAANAAYATNATNAANAANAANAGGYGGGYGGGTWPQATRLAPSTVDLAWRIGVVLHRDGRRLALAWIGGAASWLRERCEQAEMDSQPIDPAGLPQRECLLVCGWADISREQCDVLRAGDAVMLNRSTDVANGAYWVIDGEYALSYPGASSGRSASGNGVEVLRLNKTDVATAAPSSAHIFATLTTQPFPVPMLNAWRTGQLREEAVDFARAEPVLHMSHVTLLRDGVAWAVARLLRFETGQLAVCLECERDNGDTPHNIAQCPTNSGGDLMGVHPQTP